ncbi:MAG: hypothetical protein L7H18_03005 [Candidatus Nealsonbacteria bacterium DGGOD1a]|jgi:hypothetical protein|nr:MAG: hypothetical protein L7H18_03005 [Candidatus Nealsonbacteria bacterium DGGOD1a]
MNAKKIIGWVLLAVGLAVIAWTVNTSYRYFTAKADFPPVFNFGENRGTAKSQSPDTANLNVEAQMQLAMSQATQEAVANLLPAQEIAKLLNVIVWSMFAAFMVYAGFKIAEIGIKIIS